MNIYHYRLLWLILDMMMMIDEEIVIFVWKFFRDDIEMMSEYSDMKSKSTLMVAAFLGDSSKKKKMCLLYFFPYDSSIDHVNSKIHQ
jgi:hypothetical protein